MKPFITPSMDLSRNLQLFRDRILEMLKNIVELEGPSTSVYMVPELELESVKGEVRLFLEENVILESK